MRKFTGVILVSVFLIGTSTYARADEKIPYHELAAMYELCVPSALAIMPQASKQQTQFVKALCFCQTNMYFENVSDPQYEGLAQKPEEVKALTQRFFEKCVQTVRAQLNNP